jgi:integrase/recombinase XerD
MEVKGAIQSYIVDCESVGLSSHTIRVYQQRLDYFADFLNNKGIRDTEQLLADHLRAFVVELRQRDAHQFTNHRARGKLLSTRTVFHYARIIKSFGGWLADQETLPRHPFGKIKLPRVDKKLMPSMPVPAMVNMYDVIRKTGGERMARDLALYCFMIESGARASEVVHLTLDDLDLENCTAKVHGKGAKERLVCFTERTVALLNTYLEERPRVNAREVFLNLQTGKPLTPNGLGQLISKYGGRAGIHCYPHLLRHTFATRYLVNGDEKNLLSLQKLLGHETLDMVRRYVDLLPVDVKTQYRKFSPLNGLNLEDPALAGSCAK